MKNLFIIFIMAFFLVSCEEEKHSSVKMKLVPEVLIFSNGPGSTKTVKITTNVKWTITSTDSWCTITPTFGESGETDIIISVENYSGDYREAKIAVENQEGPGVRVLTVVQKKATPSEPK